MRHFPRVLPSFNGIAAGQVATCQIQGGPTIEEIVLKTNIPAAKLSVIVRLNGDPIYSLLGTDLVMLEQYRKRYVDPDKLVIYFADLVNATLESRGITGLVTFPTDNLMLEISIASDAGAGLTISGEMLCAPGRSVRAVIPRKYRTSVRAGNTTENKVYPINPGPFIQRVHFSGDLTRMRVSVEDHPGAGMLLNYDRTADVNAFQLKRNDRAPQTVWYHTDFIASDFGNADLLETRRRNADGNLGEPVNQVEWNFDLSTPGDVPVLIECFTMQTAPAGAGANAAKK